MLNGCQVNATGHWAQLLATKSASTKISISAVIHEFYSAPLEFSWKIWFDRKVLAITHILFSTKCTSAIKTWIFYLLCWKKCLFRSCQGQKSKSLSCLQQFNRLGWVNCVQVLVVSFKSIKNSLFSFFFVVFRFFFVSFFSFFSFQNISHFQKMVWWSQRRL